MLRQHLSNNDAALEATLFKRLGIAAAREAWETAREYLFDKQVYKFHRYDRQLGQKYIFIPTAAQRVHS